MLVYYALRFEYHTNSFVTGKTRKVLFVVRLQFTSRESLMASGCICKDLNKTSILREWLQG